MPQDKDRGDIDWERARVFLRDAVRKKLGNVAEFEVDDLVQDALIRLLRTLRKEDAVNLDALMTDISAKAVIDHLRARTRWAALHVSFDADALSHSEPARPGEIGDPMERAVFVVLQFFRARHGACHELAATYFRADRTWAEIAAETNRAPGAVRQEWLRCVRLLRKAARHDTTLIPDWLGGEEGDRR